MYNICTTNSFKCYKNVLFATDFMLVLGSNLLLISELFLHKFINMQKNLKISPQNILNILFYALTEIYNMETASALCQKKWKCSFHVTAHKSLLLHWQKCFCHFVTDAILHICVQETDLKDWHLEKWLHWAVHLRQHDNIGVFNPAASSITLLLFTNKW